MNAAVFHQAVADGDATRVKFLINIGQQARVNQLNKQGYTSLQQSCKDGRIDVVNVLLNHGANTSATGRKGRTALHLASAGGYADIVELLITSCAELNVKDNEGNLPVDVAKTEEITKLLSKAEAEKKAKSAEANKKCNSEEWSQNVKSLPAGSRNSLVSNSSSDSGVFTEDATSARNVDLRLSCPSTRNGNGNRGLVCDNRTMGVLNEWEEVHEKRSRFVAQTSVKPQPKLRRSMSDRFATRQRRAPLGRRDISEELSALNLSRAISRQQPEVAKNYYYDETELRDYARLASKGYANIESPNDDLGYGAEIQDDGGIDGESGRCSVRTYLTNNSRSLPRMKGDSVVCYAGGECRDEGWEEEEDEEDEEDVVLRSRPTVIRGRQVERVREGNQGIRKGWDEMEDYHRSLTRNLRSSRRRTVEVCEASHEIDWYRAEPDSIHGCLNNEQLRSCNSRSRRPHSARGNETIACEVDTYLDKRGNTLTRKVSACSDTAIGKYYQRRLQMSEPIEMHYSGQHHFDYNDNQDYYDSQICYRDNNNLPGYEETLRRFRNEREGRPASRQVSQV